MKLALSVYFQINERRELRPYHHQIWQWMRAVSNPKDKNSNESVFCDYNKLITKISKRLEAYTKFSDDFGLLWGSSLQKTTDFDLQNCTKGFGLKYSRDVGAVEIVWENWEFRIHKSKILLRDFAGNSSVSSERFLPKYLNCLQNLPNNCRLNHRLKGRLVKLDFLTMIHDR